MSKSRKKSHRLEFLLPTSIFVNSNFSPFEAIVVYLKEERDLSFREIAESLDRDERNIWTVYNRAIKKNGKKK